MVGSSVLITKNTVGMFVTVVPIDPKTVFSRMPLFVQLRATINVWTEFTFVIHDLELAVLSATIL